MKTSLVVPILALLSLTLACEDGEEDLPVTTMPTFAPEASDPITPTMAPTTPAPPSSTTTPVQSPPDLEAFREFGSEIAQAIRLRDADFFLRDPVISTLDCSASLFTECTGTLTGIWSGAWGSEAFPVPAEDLRVWLSDKFAAGMTLHALALLRHDFGGTIGGPSDIAVLSEESGDAVVLFFDRDDSRWRLRVIVGAPSFANSPNTWLTGDCLGNCYDYFELWED